jgi:hemolysin III
MLGAVEITGWPFRNPVSASTHLFWALVAMFITGLFWQLTRGDWRRRWSVMTFGLSLCLLYTASGVYHSLQGNERIVNFFRLLDHSMIYVLIAGTYTPILVIMLRGWLRSSQLVLIWAIALAGIICKWTLPAPRYEVTVALYIGMGWMGIIPMPQLIRAIGIRGVAWSVAGGILYTLGGICDAIRWPVLIPGVIAYHEVLHILDMIASATHVVFVIKYVLPYQRPPVLEALSSAVALS